MSMKRSAVAIGLLAATLAGPAAAVDCFPKVRFVPAPHVVRKRPVQHLDAAVTPPVQPVHHIRHVVGIGPKKPPRIAVASRPHVSNLAESSLAQQSIPIYLPRPVSCDKLPPLALQSLAPTRPVAPAQRLLDALAGPEVPLDTSITPGGVPASPGLPGVVGGTTGILGPNGGGVPSDGFPGGGFPGSPGGGTPGGLPSVLIPGASKPGGGTPGAGTPSGGTPGGATPGSATPGGGTPASGTPGGGTPGAGTPSGGTPGGGTPGSGTPGGGTPGGGTPGGGTPGGGTPGGGPPIIPPDSGPPLFPPDGMPPSGGPPEGPGPGGPEMSPAAIPEPSTWAMLLLGFFGVGAALRARKARRHRDAKPS